MDINREQIDLLERLGRRIRVTSIVFFAGAIASLASLVLTLREGQFDRESLWSLLSMGLWGALGYILKNTGTSFVEAANATEPELRSTGLWDSIERLSTFFYVVVVLVALEILLLLLGLLGLGSI